MNFTITSIPYSYLHANHLHEKYNTCTTLDKAQFILTKSQEKLSLSPS